MIRAMEERDLEVVAKLILQLSGQMEGSTIYRDRLRNIDTTNNAFYVSEIKGTIAGWVQVEYRPLFATESRAEIQGLVVDSSMKRLGIGTALIEIAEKWSKSRGATLVRLTTRLERIESHPFYLSHGYSVKKKSADYRKALTS